MNVSRQARKMLCVLFSLCLMLSLLSLSALAADGGACKASGCTGTYTNGFCSKGATHYEAAPADSKGVYQISNGGQLYWFAKLVDSGETDADAVLTCDITINSGVLADGELNEDAADDFRTWNPIGSNKNKYSGTFDGKGFVVSGLYYDNTSTLGSYVGLFASLDENAAVSGVTLADSYILAAANAGAIAGNNCGGVISSCVNASVIYTEGSDVGGIVGTNDGLVENCLNQGSVICESENAGGIAGYNFGTVQFCGNEGSISNKDNKNESYVGGIAGYLYNGSVLHCYNVGSIVNKGDYTGGLVGAAYDGTLTGSYSADKTGNILGGHYSMPAISDCCYLADSDTDGYTGTDVFSAGAVASGELCYALNGSASEGDLVWHQTLGTDDHPVFEGGVVYYGYTSCADDAQMGYTNTKASSVKEHTFEGDHYCTVCGKTVGECVDENTDHICDFCQKVLGECVDQNTDHACDVCGKTMGKHEAAEGKHTCDYCGEIVSQCVDQEKDHVCDICGEAVGDHEAAEGKHTCDYCGERVSECADDDNDHACDVCGETISFCEDNDSDGICDICGAELSCSRDESCVLYGFTDVNRNAWYHDALHFCVAEGMMKGDEGGTTFRPDVNISRAQVAQILYNMAEDKTYEAAKTFSDVKDGQWFYDAVMWAAANGFVLGDDGADTFRPDAPITRQELVVIIWRYMGKQAPANAELTFADAAEAESWAVEAIAWASENEFVKGLGDNKFAPKANASRAQMTQILMNIFGK